VLTERTTPAGQVPGRGFLFLGERGAQVRLLRDGDEPAAMTYLFGSVFLGLVAVRCGILLARWGAGS